MTFVLDGSGYVLDGLTVVHSDGNDLSFIQLVYCYLCFYKCEGANLIGDVHFFVVLYVCHFSFSCLMSLLLSKLTFLHMRLGSVF